MSKQKKPPVDHAVAVLREDTGTDDQKVSVTGTLAEAMAQSPEWGAAPGVQSAVQTWSGSATAIRQNAQTIGGLRAQLAAAEARQRTLRRGWLSARRQVLSSVTVFCEGSGDRVRAFHLDVYQNGRLGLLPAPEGLAVDPGGYPGEVVATWDKGIAGHGFLVQYAADPAVASTMSVPAASTRPRFELASLSPGTAIHVRVAAIDPASETGQSPWTAWILGNAR
jgi:hypothetical protein